jgi:hypothetical protein
MVMTLFTTSHWPSGCPWKVVDMRCWTLDNMKSLRQKLISCECQVTVADNAVGDAIQMDDVDEERLSHRGR